MGKQEDGSFKVGSKEFIEYADKANIPMSYRVWAYALWREAQKQAFNKEVKNERVSN